MVPMPHEANGRNRKQRVDDDDVEIT